jgi:hypothetical protein
MAMTRYEEIIHKIQKDVVLASQASVLTNIYSSLIVSNIKMPNYVKHFHILEQAVRRLDECPITLEPLDFSSVVTWCGHVFSKNGLRTWLSQSNGCPICKQTCKIVFP